MVFATVLAKPFESQTAGVGKEAVDCLSYKNAGNKESGIHPIEVDGTSTNVPCDQETRHGGWTTIMRYYSFAYST